ncbi:EAL domain-containing protein [Vibrio owensii]|uniref:EAL domain-containing protein n=1 Tax=Vibrio owensii TaxID=696485 RepID=UPI00215D4731|nr:EAL domain-containing protein [Vibrio owensii]MCR9940411.1 EAL domain-containing protein [Vibrio owensii]
MLAFIPLANQHHKKLTEQAVVSIENEFRDNVNDLTYLLDDAFFLKACNDLIHDLRASIFSLGMAKDIATFDSDGQVLCTSSERSPSFFIYKTILKRLGDSNVHATLSYTKSALTPDQALILFFTKQEGRGISVVFPKKSLETLVADIFRFGDMDYRIDVIGRTVRSPNDKQPLRMEEVASDVLPFTVYSCIGFAFYLQFLVSKLWLGLLVMAFALVVRLFFTSKKFAKNSLEFSLTQAIKSRNLSVHYQPIVDQRDGAVIGGESLVRWNDPVQGFISPGIFIPLAEKVGLIDQITYLVLDKAINMIASNKVTFHDRYISVNVSRSLILREDFIKEVESRLKYRYFISERLVFEITEEAIFSGGELAVLRKHLDRLAVLGIRIAVDDFGTGYSGLDFISQYPFDIIKIDRVFVTNLGNGQTIQPLLEAIHTLSQTLNMSVIVEGVEEQAQLRVLHDLGFYNIQGFYFSKPIPKPDFLEYLESKQATTLQSLTPALN